ncbi:thioesterase family protein [Selenomonas sp. TAMA-11512]|uniref:acyl-CoA thioesterase n=1 Tax=Selenomonas sp. TAMA-11512 TaxID=3095337 RepID=UPI0030871324|nr:thioesterase family protein [Selenomonas sp. TAMA-11512]
MDTRTDIRVHFYDTDTMAVVHHSNYIRWFEIGRVEFLRSADITLNELMEAGFVFPITEVKAKYHAPAQFDDELVIITHPEALTKAKMAFSYEIRRKEDNTLCVTGFTQNVFTDKASGKITRLPEVYAAKLQAAMNR